MELIRSVARLLRNAVVALYPADEFSCHGCHLDAQWVGSERADHSCARGRP